MKKLAATSAMAVALAISANSAKAADYESQVQQLVVSGVVEKWIGYSFISGIDNGDNDTFDPDNEDYFTSGQSGRLSLPLGDMLSLQMDADNEITENGLRNDNDDDDFAHAFGFGLHLSARDPSRGLFGVFGAFGQGKGDNNNGRHNFWAAGGEAQLYTDNVTFYLQGGYLDSEPGDDSTSPDGLHDAFFVRGVARWFMTPDSRLQGEVAYANGEQDDADGTNIDRPFDMDVIQWGVRYDTVIGGLPLIGDSAVFVGYRGTHFDTGCCGPDDTARGTEHTIMAGFSYHFGGQTLLDFDRVGATLDLPNFGRWVAAGEQLD
ncbi:MAG: hypothetical protein ABJM26_23085 [Anderseniella sp.]|uniref:hypothetical protein n=1 Tax=Parasphingorhabdus sp. TaxID=2709688 RepID=UPI0032751EA9